MTFVPASPEDAGSVTVVGTVDVSDRAARQLGHVTVDNASLAVTGPLTDAQLRASAVPVSGPLTDAQLRATPVPISAASLPLPTGAAKDSTLTDGSQRVGGTVTVSGSVNVGNFPADQVVHFSTPQHVVVDSGTVTVSGTTTVAGTVAVSSVAGTVIVDGSAVTQPVSGPLTNAQLRASAVAVDGSAVTQPVSVASLPLPTGAATEATLDEAKDSLNDVALTAILQRDKMAT